MEKGDMLFCIPPSDHEVERIKAILGAHPEVAFVSLVGADIYGNHTDEKIPVKIFTEDVEGLLREGVQTDGSSVQLPLIADISNAKVTLIPDLSVNWYVDYNEDLVRFSGKGRRPVGTLRIPAHLVHNGTMEVGSRAILRDAVDTFKRDLVSLIKKHPYVLEHLPLESAEDISEVLLTSATELEFYVKTPHEVADRDRLHTSQELKEQYWKRTIGPVRSALEETLLLLDKYGFGVEMGHKEVGGVKPEMVEGGDFSHIMEQLEIDWKYSDPMQAADNDRMVRYLVRDVFRQYGLDVTFMAKPVDGVAGSGKHTHLGASVRLKNGSVKSLFAPKDPYADYLSPIGYGALMGLLKNYEIINPIANPTTDAINRLKPGFEAPVSIVTSLGNDVLTPSRNRSVLACVIRDPEKPLGTRFELRSPNPRSNTHLVLAASLMAMLDGIKSVLEAGKGPGELEASLSKDAEADDFYLETGRMYRSEVNIFEDYSAEERNRIFGRTPATAWENINAFDAYPEKARVLFRDSVFSTVDLASFKAAALDSWVRELHDRIVPELRDRVRRCVMLHDPADCTDLDEERFAAVRSMACEIARDSSTRISLLTRLSRALEDKDYKAASDLQLLTMEKVQALEAVYAEYCRNII